MVTSSSTKPLCILLACALGCVGIGGCGWLTSEGIPSAHVSFRPAVTETLADGAADGQWTGWRGGKLHGCSPAAQLPSTWSENHNVRWQVAVPGHGNSSPVVWGDALYLTSVVPAETGEQAVLMCFDRAQGKLRWQQSVGAPVGTAHSKNGFASATPATDGQRVYASFGMLGLCAFDTNGEALWQVPMPHHQHQWGAASSPLLFENLLIHVADGEHESAIIALDKVTGQQVWRTARQSRGSWSSPVLLNRGTPEAPQWQVVVNGTGSASGSAGEVIAYDPRSGEVLWSVHGTTDIPCPTAIVGGGLVISTSGSNGPIFAIVPPGQGETEPQPVWRLPTGGAYVPTGIVYQQRLYLVSDAGMASCHRLDDGEVMWRKRLHGAFSASLVAGGGQVYAVSERGDVYVYRAGDDFELIATNRLHEPCIATPAIAHGELYLRSQQHLYCIAETNVAATEPADFSPAVEAASIRSPADIDPPTVSSPSAGDASTLSAP